MGLGSGAAYRRPLGPPPMGPAVPGDWYGWILTQTGPFWPRLDVRLAHPAPTTVTRAVPSIRPSHTVRSVAGVEVLGCTRSKPKSCRDGVPLMHCHRLGYRRSTCGRRGCWTLPPNWSSPTSASAWWCRSNRWARTHKPRARRWSRGPRRSVPQLPGSPIDLHHGDPDPPGLPGLRF